MASAGRFRKLIIIGEASLSTTSNNAVLSIINKTRVPRMKSGTASFRYHSTLISVFTSILESFGTLMGGISSKKSEASPETIFDARKPTMSITKTTTLPHHSVAMKDNSPSIPSMTPSWAEHGTPRANRSVTIILSFLLSNILAVIVAIVSQPSPRTIGSTALPLRPISLNILSTIIASLGR